MDNGSDTHLAVPFAALVLPFAWNLSIGPRLPSLLLGPFALLSVVSWLCIAGWLRRMPAALRLPYGLLLGAVSPGLTLLVLAPFVCWSPFLNLPLLVLGRLFLAQPLAWLGAGAAMGLFTWLCDRVASSNLPSRVAAACAD